MPVWTRQRRRAEQERLWEERQREQEQRRRRGQHQQAGDGADSGHWSRGPYLPGTHAAPGADASASGGSDGAPACQLRRGERGGGVTPASGAPDAAAAPDAVAHGAAALPPLWTSSSAFASPFKTQLSGMSPAFDQMSPSSARTPAAGSLLAQLPGAPPLELAGASRSDFKATEVIGEGASSKVLRATYLPTGKEYAVKVVSKALAVRHEQVRSLCTEQTCLQMVSGHPSIVQLAALLEDEHFVYIVSELCPYGDLLHLLQRPRNAQLVAAAGGGSNADIGGGGGNRLSAFGGRGNAGNSSVGGGGGEEEEEYATPLSRDAVRFYFAEIVSAVETMHNHGIIHRDLKPNNVLIGHGGHCKLADFGVAAILGTTPEDDFAGRPMAEGARRRCDSFVGTFAYLSPELLRRERSGGSFESDMWALGVLLYQMMAGNGGEMPFKGETDYLLFQSILRDDVAFGRNFMASNAGRDLVERLLTKDAARRITMEKLKRHRFFKRIRFGHLHRVDATKIVGKAASIGIGGGIGGGDDGGGRVSGGILRMTQALNSWWPRRGVSVFGGVGHSGSVASERQDAPSGSGVDAAEHLSRSSSFGNGADDDSAGDAGDETPLELFAAHERWRQPARRVLNLAVEFTGNMILAGPIELAESLLARIKRCMRDASSPSSLSLPLPRELSRDYLFAAAQLQSVDPRLLNSDRHHHHRHAADDDDGDDRRARFWTTIYQILFVHVCVVHGSPVRGGLRDERFFQDYFYRVFTLDYCLDDIENGILRVPGAFFRGWQAGDPRHALALRRPVDPSIVEALHEIRVSRGMK